MSNPTGTWTFPTTIRFGPGRRRELPNACRAAGMSRPLVVTDAGLADNPIVHETLDILKTGGFDADLYAGVKGNPSDENVTKGVEVLRAGNHDGVIAFGGGSAMDAGKAIAFMTAQSLPMEAFEDIGDNWKQANVEGILPSIAIPTTAGTGSEVGRASVIHIAAVDRKVVVFHPEILPKQVIGDPELTTGLPQWVTAATGMDALAHCLEAYCAPSFHPMAQGIAAEGARMIKDALPRAYRDGNDLEARAHMLAAAMMGCVAFQKGLGAIHAISHPVGSLYDTHHGLTNAVVMPYVLAFNRAAVESKLARLGAYLGLDDPSFDGIMAWVTELRTALGVPHTLADLGVGTDRIDRIAGMAETDPTAGGNPVPLNKNNLRPLIENAIAGRLPG
ncbi:iron-containing alcohol dehydrogenase [Ferruginivarius sediminum]|uniref:Alcohol dehydrogenase 2 n=1 Tax=Ferruginivarius sediminum TaxID=2661937 RepID=A0A369T9H0_9PROT|nr:iron-containing alcohol dehydrogenase [Ferruginivarius sediminum]RDD61940.1 iron-containing alcohol dehydrogenase [Ferruginivarius sediminum]